jgi:hypothetical protein
MTSAMFSKNSTVEPSGWVVVVVGEPALEDTKVTPGGSET